MKEQPSKTFNTMSYEVTCKEIELEIAKFNLELVVEWVKHAEQKAMTILTFATVLLGASMTEIPAATRVVEALIRSEWCWWAAPIALLHIAFYGLVAWSIRMCLVVIRPKLDRSSSRHSWFYFHSMALLGSQDYIRFCNELSEEKIRTQLCDQIYNNAKIASEKYAEVKAALKYLTYGAFCGVLAVMPVLALDALTTFA